MTEKKSFWSSKAIKSVFCLKECKIGKVSKVLKKMSLDGVTMFKNRPKCRIQYCERSELRLHFDTRWHAKPEFDLYFALKIIKI